MGKGTVNIPERKLLKVEDRLHHRLKMEAARRQVTMIDLLGELLDAHLPPDPATRGRKQARKPDAISA